MFSKQFWLTSNWLRAGINLQRGIARCSVETDSIDGVLKSFIKARKDLYKGIKLMDLYLIDSYCLSTIGKPAFCIQKKELSLNICNVGLRVRDGSISLIDCLLSTLYGDISASKQLGYVSKWVDLNVVILKSIWEEYGLPISLPLGRKDVDIGVVRESYLRKLDIMANKKGLSSIERITNSNNTNVLKVGSRDIIKSLLDG